MIYYCSCGKGIEYSLEKPKVCPKCQNKFDVVEATIDSDKLKEKRLARENKLKKMRQIEAEEVEETENEEDVELDDNIDVPEVSPEDVLVEGVGGKDRGITVGEIYNQGMVQSLPRGKPEAVSTKKFLKQFSELNGSRSVVQKSHSVKGGK